MKVLTNQKFSGVMSALVSCVDEQENVKEDAMRRLMNWHLKEGMSGFYLTGGTGEGPVLQKETRKRIVEIAKDEAGGRCSLIVHVGAIDLRTAVELARHASDVGVDAISSVPPFFFKYGEPQIRDYYQALSDASGLPLLMYASPLAGVAITRDMVERLMAQLRLLHHAPSQGAARRRYQHHQRSGRVPAVRAEYGRGRRHRRDLQCHAEALR